MITPTHTNTTSSQFENVEPSIVRFIELSRLNKYYTKIILHLVLDLFEYNTIFNKQRYI